MRQENPSPARQIELFLKFIGEAHTAYEMALEQQKEEERRETDLSHELEFAIDAKERNQAGRKLQRCLRDRRKYKDTAHLYQQLEIFFGDDQNLRVLNRMKQLLGRQRKEEEYLYGDREYKKKVWKEDTVG